MNFRKPRWTYLVSSGLILACVKTPSETETRQVDTAHYEAIREKTPAVVHDDFTLSLWASDSLAPDPIAMSITDQGEVYITRSNRMSHSEFDIRGHQDWMTQSIGFQRVEDRQAFLRSTFAPANSEKNTWLEDLNGDGSHDWLDLTVAKEEIWKIQDNNRDGKADLSTRVVADFHTEVTDVAHGLLVRGKDAFVSASPHVWRLENRAPDGTWKKKTPIVSGYGVHIGFGGHGMSGVTEGPDGRIYWSIGDLGAEIKTVDGKVLAHPHEGTIVRCNPDGTDLEVFAKGLRNVHEFVFDDYGNLITADNDGDHPGESERLVHLVEGSDAGWRTHWQFGKYTDPKNNTYKVWMDEKLFVPRWNKQAAHIIPPIQNFHNGPTGMQYNPGTGFGKQWKNHFFLVEFVGAPSGSGIWAFSLKPQGASFTLNKEQRILSGVLPTAIRFTPEGSMLVSDWLNGWGTKGQGRIWKLDTKQTDLLAERKKTYELLQADFSKISLATLQNLLGNEDRRVRLKAQFELVHRKNTDVFASLVQVPSSHQLARVHAIWGLGQLARQKMESAKSPLRALLNDPDPEIVAQALKTLGDIRDGSARASIREKLVHPNDRVRFYAAEALGRIGKSEDAELLFQLIALNQDRDVYIRHAAILALSRIQASEACLARVKHPNTSERIAAIVALRRMQYPGVAQYLKDSDPQLVLEAARAIHDDGSIAEALPALASMITHADAYEEALTRRIISACLRLGREQDLENLIEFAQKTTISPVLKAEALAVLSVWADPSPLDRVDGRFRGYVKRSLPDVQKKIRPLVQTWLKSNEPMTQVAAVELVGRLQLAEFGKSLEEIYQSNPDKTLKMAVLKTMTDVGYAQAGLWVRKGLEDEVADVRTVAIGQLSKLSVSKDELPGLIAPVFAKGTVREKQRVLQTLQGMPTDNTRVVLDQLVSEFALGKLEREVMLDLAEAVEKNGDSKIQEKWNQVQSKNSPLEEFQATLYGGNAWEGRNYFLYNSTGQCVRCHTFDKSQTGTVGPNLAGIGTRLDRNQLLQALIEPSARLAPGYGLINLILSGGQEVSGTLLEESETSLLLRTTEAEPLTIAKSRIQSRENYPSSMPSMGAIMSKKDIRNMVEFLSSLK